MGHLIFYAHAGSGNHGCEAIVRASAKIIGKPITVFSMNEAQDRLYRNLMDTGGHRTGT